VRNVRAMVYERFYYLVIDFYYMLVIPIAKAFFY